MDREVLSRKNKQTKRNIHLYVMETTRCRRGPQFMVSEIAAEISVSPHRLDTFLSLCWGLF